MVTLVLADQKGLASSQCGYRTLSRGPTKNDGGDGVMV